MVAYERGLVCMNRSFKETWWPTSICHNTKYHFENRFSIFFDAPQLCIKFFFLMQREEFLSQSLELSFTNKQIPSG
jgi:hypothetical protein